MKAIIVAGGRGERLKPLTDNIPKPMVEVNSKPLLLHIINLFKKNGINDLVIALCYLPDVITNFFGDGSKFGVKITYTYENPNKPLGTAGAILLARKLIDSTFIVTYADILRDINMKKMIKFHKFNRNFATINVYKRTSKDVKSIVFTKDDRITQFIERPAKKYLTKDNILSNGSFYIFNPDIFQFIPENKKVDFGLNIFPQIIKSKKIFAYQTSGYFVDIGDIKKLEYARNTWV